MPDEPRSKRASENTDWFVDLVAEWETTMFVTAKRILGNATDAQEARQNVLLNILRTPERLPQEGLEYWIRRCIINESLRILRRRRTELKANERCTPSNNGLAADHQSALEFQETSEALQNALVQLSPELRVLLTLRFDDELTIRQIASVVNKPHTTVQSQLRTAIQRLRVMLANFASE